VSAREIEQHAGLRAACPGFSGGGALGGSRQVRTLATVAGNMCTAAPSADRAPPLVALEAEAVIAGPKGRRRVPMTDFFTGVRKTVLGPAELLVEFVIPPGPARG